ncbi:MAG: succinate dehydrogenase [Bryobacteraceae bacterium]
MAAPDLIWKDNRFLATSRRDSWWTEPMFDFVFLATFLLYANWAAWQGNHYFSGPYLSPFYSPEIWGDSSHALLGPKPQWWPAYLPFSPALLILWAPGLFRFTCYYYRGVYYKAFWSDPPNCTVGEPRSSYLGERTFPLVMQNLHRYFMYLAMPFIWFLTYDVWKAMWFEDMPGQVHFGIGLGTLLLATNVTLLTGYVTGCHSYRHWIGGKFDELSKKPLRLKAYRFVCWLNHNHKKWAWASLFTVGSSDLYVRLCSMGVIRDWRLF